MKREGFDRIGGNGKTGGGKIFVTSVVCGA